VNWCLSLFLHSGKVYAAEATPRGLQRPLRIRTVRLTPFTVAAVILACLAAAPAAKAQQFQFKQLTASTHYRGNWLASFSAGDRLVTFGSFEDYVGNNWDGFAELFRVDEGGTITQVTDSFGCYPGEFSTDSTGMLIAFRSACDFLGENPDRNHEIYLLDLNAGTMLQITRSSRGQDDEELTNRNPSMNSSGDVLAFESDADLAGGNPDRSVEIFLWRRAGGLVQLTDSLRTHRSMLPSIDSAGRFVAFVSNGNLTGSNPHGCGEVFLWRDGAGITQVTTAFLRVLCGGTGSVKISADGSTIAFSSRSDFNGGNTDHNQELFLWTEEIGLRLLTDSQSGWSRASSIDTRGVRVAFESDADHLGTNADGNVEIFLWVANRGLVQVTQTIGGSNDLPALGQTGFRLAFSSNHDFTGGNPDRNSEIFLVTLSPLTVAKTFSPTTIALGATSALTVTIANPNPFPVHASFVDTYPAGLLNATPAGAATTCAGGAIAAGDGGGTLQLTNGTVPAAGNCSVSVAVTGAGSATVINTIAAGAITTSEGPANDSSASAQLEILAPIVVIPALSPTGLAILALAIVAGAWHALRRR